MSTEVTINGVQGRGPKHSKVATVAELALGVILSGWIVVEYLRNASLQDYVKSTINSNSSILQFTVPIGVVLIVGSVFIRKRNESREAQAALRREEALRKINFSPTPMPVKNVPHQLFTIPRPARDPNFRVGKKRPKGKISRNRGGQRLPPGDQHPSEIA
jgi:hypothetical protein